MESGSVEVQKLILMQKDFQINKDLQKEFQLYLDNKIKKNINKVLINFEMVPTVLAQGYWPFSITEEDSIIIPPELTNSTHIFESFYNEKHQNRSLKWLFAQGNCVVSANIFDKKYQFVVSNYQLLIFLVFNRDLKKYTVNEIQILTKIPLEELEVCLASLNKIGIFIVGHENEGNTNKVFIYFVNNCFFDHLIKYHSNINLKFDIS